MISFFHIFQIFSHVTNELLPFLSLCTAIFGFIEFWRAQKLAKKTQEQQKNFLLVQSELSHIKDVRQEIWNDCCKIRNKNAEIVHQFEKIDIELLDNINLQKLLSIEFFSNSLNSFIQKSETIIEDMHIFDRFIANFGIDNTDNIFFQCEKCSVIYLENKLTMWNIQTWLDLVRERIREESKKYRSNSFISPLDFNLIFRPLISFWTFLLKVFVYNFSRISVISNKSIKIVWDYCSYCQNEIFRDWWKQRYPQNEIYNKLVEEKQFFENAYIY